MREIIETFLGFLVLTAIIMLLAGAMWATVELAGYALFNTDAKPQRAGALVLAGAALMFVVWLANQIEEFMF